MGCQCYTIGGPFIAEDPDCPAHGREAQRRDQRRSMIIERCRHALSYGPEDAELTRRALVAAIEFLESES